MKKLSKRMLALLTISLFAVSLAHGMNYCNGRIYKKNVRQEGVLNKKQKKQREKSMLKKYGKKVKTDKTKFKKNCKLLKNPFFVSAYMTTLLASLNTESRDALTQLPTIIKNIIEKMKSITRASLDGPLGVRFIKKGGVIIFTLLPCANGYYREYTCTQVVKRCHIMERIYADSWDKEYVGGRGKILVKRYSHWPAGQCPDFGECNTWRKILGEDGDEGEYVLPTDPHPTDPNIPGLIAEGEVCYLYLGGNSTQGGYCVPSGDETSQVSIPKALIAAIVANPLMVGFLLGGAVVVTTIGALVTMYVVKKREHKKNALESEGEEEADIDGMLKEEQKKIKKEIKKEKKRV
jgi:hypothetical protein